MSASQSRRLTLCGYHLDLRRPVSAADTAHESTRDYVFPIVRSKDGRKYLVVSDANGTYGLPYEPRRRLDGDVLTAPGRKRVRGYLSLDEIAEEALTHVPKAPPQRLLAHAAARSLADGGAAPDAPTATPRPFPEAHPPPSLSPLQTQLLSGAITNLLGDGTLVGQGGAMGAIVGALASALGMKTGELLQRALPLDDHSSSGEYLTSIAAQQAAAKVQGWLLAQLTGPASRAGDAQSLLQQLDTFFTGETSNAYLPACRDGDADDSGGVVLAANEAQVWAEGKPLAAAFSADRLIPSFDPIVNGSQTVLAKDKPVARCTSQTRVPSTLVTGAPSVLVGGRGFSPEIVEIAQRELGTTMPSGAECGLALDAMRRAQVAFDKAMANGQGIGAASAIAAEAAKAPPLTPKARMLVANVIYAEDGDFRGLELVSDEDGKRVFSLDEHGPQCHETYDLRADTILADGSALEGDTILVDGSTLKVERINNPASGAPDGYLSMWLVDAKTGQAVLAFSGTDEAIDWYDNVAQAFGRIPPQYEQALKDAQAFQALHPGGEIVGHSLGGGLAAFAGFVTGLTTTSYNGAGLGSGALDLIHQRGVPAHLANVTQIQISGEILTGLAEFFIAPGTSGHLIEISPAGDDVGPLGLHYMQEIVMALTGNRILVLQSQGHDLQLPAAGLPK